ncbi:MAG: ATP-dependent helicase [Bacteroidetes bacterium]|nr:ATP-dependent helicase [Bacteroidota bacterium]
MRIPAESSFELIYSVTVHPQLGPLMEAYIVQLTSQGNLSLVNQRIHANNADYYDKKLDSGDYEAIRLLEECTPEFIVKKFSKVKKIRPKEFFDKYFSAEQFKNSIRPHIEKRLVQVMKLIFGKKVFIKELNNVIFEELNWSHEIATVLFHLRRNENNTHYFATVKHNQSRVHISQSNAILLTEQPCYLLSAGMILRFDESVDGQKILPFLQKRFIEIPRKSEEMYFRKFLVPLLEEYDVYAVGFEIKTEKYEAVPVVHVSRLLNGTIGLILKFRYGKDEFNYQSGKTVSVKLNKQGEEYTFIRIKRSRSWEDIKKEVLIQKGLKNSGSEFFVPDTNDELSIIHWLKFQLNDLRKAGFEIEQKLPVPYSLDPESINYTISNEQDWFDVKAEVKFGAFSVPFIKLRQQILSGATTIQLPDGSLAIIPPKWIEQIKGLDEFSDDKNNLKIHRMHYGLLNDIGENSFGIQNEKGDRVIDTTMSYPVPNHFNGTLRAYQKAGYDWLNFLRANHFGGCLADDMGLGKTVQTLAFLQKIKEELPEKTENDLKLAGQVSLFETNRSAGTSLLVVPTSLIHNWYYEAKNFTPDLTFLIHTGMNRTSDVEKFGYYDVVLTTYGTVRNDIDMLKVFPFNVIVLDESQFIKNPASRIAKCVYQLRGESKIVLTGTPVENSITDLWSQMHFVNPGLLGSYKSFKQNYVQSIEKDFDEEKTRRLHSIIKPFVMRRTKRQVASDLPPKTEQIIYCDMSEEQADIYEKTKSTYRNMILDSIRTNGMNKSRIQILSGLTKLRQMANHPLLSDESYAGGSGKFDQVEQMLMTALEEGHKVLMFSQFVGHLSIYRKLLDDQKIDYAYLDGKTSAEIRREQVKKFQNSETSVFLISLKAGGFGLNLTAADYVFLLDPWWNPAAENQATDRAHRIGQEQNVFSYKFVTGNSVEEKIIRLQERKKTISDALIKTEESFVKTIDESELIEILT